MAAWLRHPNIEPKCPLGSLIEGLVHPHFFLSTGDRTFMKIQPGATPQRTPALADHPVASNATATPAPSSEPVRTTASGPAPRRSNLTRGQMQLREQTAAMPRPQANGRHVHFPSDNQLTQVREIPRVGDVSSQKAAKAARQASEANARREVRAEARATRRANAPRREADTPEARARTSTNGAGAASARRADAPIGGLSTRSRWDVETSGAPKIPSRK